MIERDMRLGADELENLSAILASCQMEIKSRIASETNTAAKEALRQQQTTLDHAADKITEACAMA